MAEKYYLDTSIWRDYYENRSDGLCPLGEFALQLIKKIIEEGNFILYSDWVIHELKIRYSDEEIVKLFEIVKDKDSLLKVDISNFQVNEAKKLCKIKGIAFGDALHAILARDNGASMVARDNHLFEVRDVVEISKPEELI